MSADSEDVFSADADFDNDGLSNLFEFAFDVEGTATEVLPAFGDSTNQVSAQVTVEVDSETGLCELTVGKRRGVRETIEYYFEEVNSDGSFSIIEPGGEDWTLVEDSNLVYKVISNEPVSGTSFYRGCARKNTFGVEVTN